jgi:hypothetical protein
MEYKCNVCNKIYSSYQSLWIHNKKYHPIIAPIAHVSTASTHNSGLQVLNNHNCKFCNKNFSRNYCVTRHEQTCKQKVEDNKIVLLENKIKELEKVNNESNKVVVNLKTKCNYPINSQSIEGNTELKIENNVSYIYLIQEREHFEKNQNIFKIGRTTQEPNNKICRLLHYKKGSKIFFVMNCCNDKVGLIEGNIKTIFKEEFKSHTDGFEHYIGDKDKMIDIIFSEIKKYK